LRDYGGYQPVVDPRTDPNYANIQQDSAECTILPNRLEMWVGKR